MRLKITTLLIHWGLSLIASAGVSVTQEQPTGNNKEQIVSIENGQVKLSFNVKSGFYSVSNQVDGYVAVKDAVAVVQPGTSWKGPTGVKFNYSWAEEPVQDELGKGKTLIVTGVCSRGYAPNRILRYTVYENQPQVILGWGIHNRLGMPVRIQEIYPLYGGQLFTGQKMQAMQILQSGSGGARNYVVQKLDGPVNNGLLATYKSNGKRYSLVIGGARYEEFIREVNITKKYTIKEKTKKESLLAFKGDKLSLRIHDPYGKRVEAGATYISPDTAYLDVVTRNPFESYERYGKTLQIANNAQPNFYTSPILCGWTASVGYGTGVKINSSTKLVNELKQANEKGLNKYFKPGVRLEPDKYPYGPEGNTEQGWWSDAVLQKAGHMSGEYDTWAKFGKAVEELGGKVVTYSQSSLPSRDFAQKYPEFLINNDNSLAYADFFHPLPTARYDFTDPGFQAYFVKRWKYIGDSGISGVKVDYPATSWEVNGGFEDKSYTTTKAYREQFKLYRKALGAGATIHERVLGGKVAAPITDATAGIVDLQRVWTDSSHIEPEMVSRIGLRWYKNRKVYSYYEDAKNFYVAFKNAKGKKIELPAERRQTILTLSGFLSGKLDLATSYTWMTPANAAELAKIYPVIQERKSPRPVDMLLRKEPTTYVYDVNERWSQVMLVNPDEKKGNTISAPLSGAQADTGSLGMNKDKQYYVFDFWNQKLVGKMKGSERLSVDMKPMQALIFAVREVENQPQVISTDRHFMQGMVELKDVTWDAKRRILSGHADVIGGDRFVLTLAANGAKVKSAKASKGTAKLEPAEHGLHKLILQAAKSETIRFEIQF